MSIAMFPLGSRLFPGHREDLHLGHLQRLGYLLLLLSQEFVIPEEEAEWVGLSLEEAIEKQRLLEKKVSTTGYLVQPLNKTQSHLPLVLTASAP